VSAVEVGWDDIDGVPTVYLRAGQYPGPLRAGLLFGVGRNEEHLPNSGITHAVEHLALQPIGKTSYSWNGSVSLVSTSFPVMGDPEQVVAHLAQVGSQLRQPRLERLQHELQVLHVEAEGRTGGRGDLDLSIRFGPQGVGLPGWEAMGLRSLQPDDVMHWVHTWFTRCNATLWLSGPPPAGLQLRDLPSGKPLERGHSRPVVAGGQLFAGVDTRLSSLSMLSDGWALGTVLSVARDRAQARLRDRDAVSYAIAHNRARLHGMSIHSLSADGAEGSQQQIFQGLVEILEELSDAGPTGAELEEAALTRSQNFTHPDNGLAYLHAWRERHLLGLPHLSPDESMDRLSALTSEVCRDELRHSMATLFAIGAQEIHEPPNWERHSDWTATTVRGALHQPFGTRERGELVFGPDGLSWALDQDHRRTVRWDEVVGCLGWSNGVRTVIGPKGDTVVVVPWNWQAGNDLSSEIDARIASELQIDMGEGELQCRTDPDDAQSVVDVRWLSSIVGAFFEQQRADVVISTDGLLVLSGKTRAADVEARLHSLQFGGRDGLLAEHPHNRWLPEKDVVEAKLSKRPLAKLATIKATLKVRTASGRIQVDLVNESQVAIVATWLPQLLGARYAS
jgi:zinc protease